MRVANLCGWSPENGSDMAAPVGDIAVGRFIELNDEKAISAGIEGGIVG